MQLTLPPVKQCDALDCSYNRDRQCHAAAITVGGEHPYCDTYMKSSQMKGGVPETGEVGACKVFNCEYNQNLECKASGIDVSMHEGHADCFTFKARS